MRFDPKLRSVEASRIWHPIHQKVFMILSILPLHPILQERIAEVQGYSLVYVSIFSATLVMRTWRFEGGGNVMVSPFLSSHLPSYLPCGARSGLARLGIACIFKHAAHPT